MKKTYRTPLLGYVKMRSVQLMELTATLSTSEDDKITSSDGFGARDGDEDFEDF